jgi:hypothetical protein
MKKALIAAALGLATVVSSHAQGGHIFFDNYDSTPYMPVLWGAGNGVLTGTSVATSDVHVDLLYSIGTVASATTDLGLSVAINPSSQDSFGNHGYFEGGIINIPGYPGGPVTFQVQAWLTTGPLGGATYGQSRDRGISAAWTEPSLAGGTTPAQFFQNLPGPNGAPLLELTVPEPSVFVLSGIALTALTLNRKRKARMPSPRPEQQL